MLKLSDVGVPFLAARLGYSVSSPPLPAIPRRDAAEVITIATFRGLSRR